MIDQATIDAILAGEFGGEFATAKEKEVRSLHVVTRIGVTSVQPNVQNLIDECQHTPGVWIYGDNRWWVVDIRPKDPAAVSLGSRGGSVTGGDKADAARENGKRGGRPRKATEA